jgi:hypothetical protein
MRHNLFKSKFQIFIEGIFNELKFNLKLLLLYIYGVILLLIISIIIAFPVMLLWNIVIPDIFGLPEIGFVHAIGLVVLLNLTRRFISNK